MGASASLASPPVTSDAADSVLVAKGPGEDKGVERATDDAPSSGGGFTSTLHDTAVGVVGYAVGLELFHLRIEPFCTIAGLAAWSSVSRRVRQLAARALDRRRLAAGPVDQALGMWKLTDAYRTESGDGFVDLSGRGCVLYRDQSKHRYDAHVAGRVVPGAAVAPHLDLIPGFTVEAWIWIPPARTGYPGFHPSPPTYSAPIVGKHGPALGWELRACREQLGFVLTTAPLSRHTEHYVKWTPQAERWTHVAATYSSDGATLELFHDGKCMASIGLTPEPLGAATRNQLGVGMNTSWKDRRVRYKFDSVRIAARVLAPSEFLPGPT